MAQAVSRGLLTAKSVFVSKMFRLGNVVEKCGTVINFLQKFGSTLSVLFGTRSFLIFA